LSGLKTRLQKDSFWAQLSWEVNEIVENCCYKASKSDGELCWATTVRGVVRGAVDMKREVRSTDFELAEVLMNHNVVTIFIGPVPS